MKTLDSRKILNVIRGLWYFEFLARGHTFIISLLLTDSICTVTKASLRDSAELWSYLTTHAPGNDSHVVLSNSYKMFFAGIRENRPILCISLNFRAKKKTNPCWVNDLNRKIFFIQQRLFWRNNFDCTVSYIVSWELFLFKSIINWTL